MNTLFSINFRREAYQRELARTRRRAVQLGLWVFYFGAFGVVLGLYGLNLSVLTHRVAYVERQVERLRHQSTSASEWHMNDAMASDLVHYLHDIRGWRTRLQRLPVLLPTTARLRSLQFNPDNTSGSASLPLIITGEMRSGPGSSHVQQVMSFVNTLSRDSVFASGYHNIRLITTRATADGGGAEFVIECR